MRKRRRRSTVRVRPKFQPELLEQRLLLASDLGSPYAQVSADWFGAPQSHVDSKSGATEWIIRLSETAVRAAAGVDAAAGLLADLPVSVVRGLGLPGQLLVSSAQSAEVVTEALASNSWIADYQVNHQVSGAVVPDDPLFNSLDQYGLFNIGQNFGTSDADIDADDAWNITTGSADVVIAVIDSGIDYTHPDLAANIWTNPGGVLDPEGLTEIVHGWDFANDDNDPTDDHGHGTHVAGIIGATANNDANPDQGIAGVNWTTSLLPLKLLNENNAGSVADAIEAINYTTDLRINYDVNVRAINASWGGFGIDDPMLEAAINAAGDAGILFVTAAGNGDVFGRGQNIDDLPFFPASFGLDNMLTVGATDRNDEPTTFTNFGDAVDLAAPGQSIWSTELVIETGQPTVQTYGVRSGTSMSTPLVTGVAALAWSIAPDATLAEVRQAILDGGDSLSVLQGQTATGRRLNALGALKSIPPQVEVTQADDVLAIGGTSYQFTVTLNKPSGDDLVASSVGDGDFFIRGTAGNTTPLTATLVSSPPATNAPEFTSLTYEITPPGGMWDAVDAGTFEIVLAGDEVTDTTGGQSIEKVVGTFDVDLSSLGVFRPTVFYDAVDAAIDGTADDGTGEATLRAAIQEANAHGSAATVILAPGTYTLSLTGAGEDASEMGDLDITGEVTIAGDGTGEVIIDAAGIDRGLDVQVGATLSLDSVTVTGGIAQGEEGGGVRNQGTLAVHNVSVAGNTAISTVNTTSPDFVSLWQADGDFADSVGTNDGQLPGVNFSPGQIGQAFDFDGTANSRVDVPISASLQTQEFTTEAWVYSRKVVSQDPIVGGLIVGTDGSPLAPYAMYGPGSTGQFVFQVGHTDGTSSTVVSPSSFSQNQWYHVAMTWDGTTLIGYVNGQMEGIDAPGAKTIDYNGTGLLTIGSWSPVFGSGREFEGLIDEVKFYDQALDQSDIQAAMNGTLVSPALLSHWAGEGDFVDSAGASNGQVPGAPAVTFAPGQSGQAFDFNATSQSRVDVPISPELQRQTISTEAWVFARSVVSQDPVVGGLIAGTDGSPLAPYAMYGPGNSGKFVFQLGHTDETSSTVISNNSFALNEWHHVVMTWDGTTLRGYVNGQLEGTFVAGAKSIDYGGTERLTIGSWSPLFGAGREFDGLIDQVAVYGRALTADEVGRLFHPPSFGGGIANLGMLTIDSSTLSGNSAESGGGLWNDANAIVTNTTFSGNTAEVQGGGIYNTENGTVDVTNSTVTENSTEAAGTPGLLSPTTGETRVNTTTSADQFWPDVAMNQAGRTSVSWTTLQNSKNEIAVRLYDESGAAVGNEIIFGTTGTSNYDSEIAVTGIGDTIVSWTGDGVDGGISGVDHGRLDTSGNQIGVYLGANNVTAGPQKSSALSANEGGDFIVAFTDFNGLDGSGRGVYGRLYDENAVAQGNQFLLATETPNDQDMGAIAFDNQSIIATWFGFSNGPGYTPHARIFDSDGTPVGNQFSINQTSISGGGAVWSVVPAENHFIIHWVVTGSGAANGWYVRLFDRTGAPLTDEIRVINGDPEPAGVGTLYSDITLLRDDYFAFAWAEPNGDGDGTAVKLQLYDSLATPVGPAQLVNTTTSGEQRHVKIASNDDDSLAVVWRGNGTGDGDGVFMRRFEAVADNGPGIFNASGTFNLQNTIVAGNTSTAGAPDVTGNFTSDGNNLIGDVGNATGFVNGVNGDQVGDFDAPIDPLLGPLQDNGGPTFTHRPLAGSPAIDAGLNAGAPAVDQRGVARPADGDNDGTDTVDVGAVEVFFASVAGKKFEDANANGIQDPGELGVAGWTIYLDLNGNDRHDTGEPFTVTDASGDYLLKDIVPGTYTVAEEDRSGWTRTFTSTFYSSHVQQGLPDSLGATVEGLTGVHEIAMSPDGQFAYAINNDPAGNDSLVVFRRNVTTGALEFVQNFTTGTIEGDGQVFVSPDGDHVYALGADSNAVVEFTRDQVTGMVAFSQSLSGPVAPMDIALSADGQNIYSIGGLVANGLHTFFSPSPGTWVPLPTHAQIGVALALTPDGKWLYTTTGSDLASYSRNAAAGGTLTSIFTPFTTGQPASGGGTADALTDVTDLEISPDGQFLYTLSRGDQSIGVYQINVADGALTFIEKIARGIPDSAGTIVGGLDGAKSLTISPTGDRLYATGDGVAEDSVAIFRRDTATGQLLYDEALKQFGNDGASHFFITLGNPDGIVVSPDGRDIYVVAADTVGTGVINQILRDGEGLDERTLLVGEDLTGVNFSNFAAPGEIRGTVFNDENDNGFRDPTEEGLPSRTVYLDLDNSNTFDDETEPFTTTDVLGSYKFENLSAPMQYTVRMELPNGQAVTLPSAADDREWTIDLDPDEIFVSADFLVHVEFAGQSSGISGVVFQDDNGNGVQDGGEPFLNGREVYLDANDNGEFDTGEPKFVTAGTGDYAFTGLGATDYIVRVIPLPGELTSTPIGNQFTKQTLTTGANPLGLVAAEFDGLHGLDLVSVDGSANQVSVRLQQSDGSFAPRVGYDVNEQPTGIAVGRFDDDAHLDMAVVHWASSRIIFLTGNGDGTFDTSPVEIPTPIGFTNIIAADFNNDTFDDLAIAVDAGFTQIDLVRVLINNNGAAPSFSALADVDLGTGAPLSFTAGNLNGDAFPDIVVGNFDSDTVQVLLNSGGTSFTAQTAIPVGDGPSSVAIVDIGGDANLDVVGTSIGTNSVFRLLGNGAGGLTPITPVPVGLGPRSIAAANIDGDSDVDLIVGNALANDVVVLRNTGGEFGLPESTGLASFASLVASGVKQVVVADLDENGVLDLAAVRGDSTTGSLAILHNALAPGSHRLLLDGETDVGDQHFGITVAAPSIPGDYDNSGMVDELDFVFWQTHFGATTGTGLAADGNGNNVVDAADYTVWRDNLGATAPGSLVQSQTDGAEPAAGLLAVDVALAEVTTAPALFPRTSPKGMDLRPSRFDDLATSLHQHRHQEQLLLLYPENVTSKSNNPDRLRHESDARRREFAFDMALEEKVWSIREHSVI